MIQSFKEFTRVSQDHLQERLESVKDLSEAELEAYSIMKDTATGEHYLHYAYVHRDLASGGAEELYHHLMPIEVDHVLSYVFGEQPYTYPMHWQRAFLRNGPEGYYVWFDPTATEEEEELAAVGQEIEKRLSAFREQGNLDEDAVRKLMEEIDAMWQGKRSK